MEKQQICRICLVDNFRMYVIADKSLQETYEKLTDCSFVTEDSRPMLACSFCYTKLKQCSQLQRTCLEAEKMFAQMLNNWEPKLLRSQKEFAHGYVKTSIEIISIVDDGQSDTDAIEIELPAARETLHDVLEIKIERQSDDFGPENSYEDQNSSLYVEGRPAHHATSDSEDDVPLGEVKTEVETVKEEMEDLFKKQYGDQDLEQGHPDAVLPDIVHIPPYRSRWHSEDIEDNLPLLEVQTEMEELVEKKPEVSEKKISAKKTRKAAVAKKSKPKDDTSTRKLKKIARLNSKSLQTTQGHMTSSLSESKDPLLNTKRVQRGNDSIFNLSDLINNAIDNNFGSKSDGKNTLHRQNTKSDDESAYKCDVCDRSFSDKSNLRRHVIGHGEAPFKCNLCERGFHAKSHLVKHRRTHTGERPFQCDQCSRCFSERSNLIKHLRRHTGDKPYKCDVCQRSFNQKYHLQSHSLVHTGEKPYKCDVCQQGFNRLYNFKQHYRTHTGEKPHECIMCSKTFTHKTSLTNHMRNHTGEKPFKCFVCQRSFTHKQSLDMHFRKHTGEKPYKCDVCQKCFTQGSHLKQHLARNHIGDKP